MKLSKAVKHCMETVRKGDSENYFVALFTPQKYRNSVWASRAFNLEISHIQDQVKDQSLGKIRFEWWRQVIDSTFEGHPIEHPISLAIAEALETTQLSKSWFRRIISAREKFFMNPHFATMNDMELYAENTASSLLYLHLEGLGQINNQADHSASHLGKAIGISTMLRGIPFELASHRLCIPSEILAKHNFSAESIIRNGPNSKLHDAVFEIATRANNQLASAQSFQDSLMPEIHPALLMAVPCHFYLQRLEKVNFDVFAPLLQKKSLLLPFRIWNSARKLLI